MTGWGTHRWVARYTSGTTLAFNPQEHTKQQCLGIPCRSTEARIVDPDTLQKMPEGEQGEIIMRGPQNFPGCWKRPDAMAAAFVELDGKRFFRSGDLRRMNTKGLPTSR